MRNESKWPNRVSNPALWLLSQTMSLVVHAKLQYLLNVLFCEPSDIRKYKRKLYMYRVPEFLTMLTLTNGRASEAQSAKTWLREFESHRRWNSSNRKRCFIAHRISLSS